MRCLPNKKYKISPGSPAVATEWMAPKICQGQPLTMYSQYSGFYSNQFTIGGVIAERVNTVKARRKVNPIFGWSIASSRIITNTHSISRSEKIRWMRVTPVYVAARYERISFIRTTDKTEIFQPHRKVTGGSLSRHIFTTWRYARAVYTVALCLLVRLSTPLSVTSRYCTKMAKLNITQTMLHNSARTHKGRFFHRKIIYY